MKEISQIFIGKHNFKGFCSSQSSSQDFVRTIYKIEIFEKKSYLNIEITGSGFLMHMVRILVGTMLDYSQNKISKTRIEKALNEGKRELSGRTMPPQGLYLKKVNY